MKKSSYILFAALIAGALAVMLVSSALVHFGRTTYLVIAFDEADLSDTVSLPLPSFSTIVSRSPEVGNSDRHIYCYCSGFACSITEDKNAVAPRIIMPRAYAEYIRYGIAGADSLEIGLDFTERIKREGQHLREIEVSYMKTPVSLVVPPGMLKAFSGTTQNGGVNQVSIYGMTSQAFTFDVTANLNLLGCEIDSLSGNISYQGRGYGTTTFSLQSSKVSALTISDIDHELTLLTDNYSSVTDFSLMLSQGSASAVVNLESARVGRFSCADTCIATVRLSASAPFSVDWK